jgi:ribosomal 50S subunit-associated protein YjgA (DUF615 family)
VRKEIDALADSIAKLDKRIEDNGESISVSQADYKVAIEAAKKLGIKVDDLGDKASQADFDKLR